MTSAPKTVVITGGSGFVGTYLQQELTSAWPGVRVVSWDLPEVDITDPNTYEAQLKELAPDWVVHLAAIASVPAALKNPVQTEAVNVGGTKKLIETIQRSSQDTKMLFVSTADVYGMAVAARTGEPVPELALDECEPANPYAQSKLAAEEVVLGLMPKAAIRVRPFPHIGPGQGLGFVTSDFASQIAAIEAGNQEPRIAVGNLEAQRDFTDVRDVVRAYRMLMETGEAGEVYHVASGKPVAIKDVLDALLEMAKVEIEVVQDESRMRPSDVPVLVGSAAKLQGVSSWQPEILLQKSLSDILDWWRQQESPSA